MFLSTTCLKLLPIWKQSESKQWLKLCPSQPLQQVIHHLSDAFKNFFEGRAKLPRYKSRKGKQSLTFPSGISISGNCLKFPKLGLVKVKLTKKIPNSLRKVTITKNPSGQYFASLLFEDGLELPLTSSNGKSIGIDLGITHIAIDSEGNKYDNPRWLKTHQSNLKIKQQKLARKEKASSHREKARIAVAKIHNKIANCRSDFLHKLSRKIVNENQVIVVEDLNVSGMVKNRKLAKAIIQNGFGNFSTMLKYKAEQLGKIYHEVNRFFPSSKTCNCCGHKIDKLSLDIRQWTCPNCGVVHDRDINAAKNIINEGLRNLGLERP